MYKDFCNAMMSDTEFAKGIDVKKFSFDNGGFIIKMGINKAEFLENVKFNDKGWANFEIKFSRKTGEPYCVVNNYKKKEQSEETTELPSTDVDEIPF